MFLRFPFLRALPVLALAACTPAATVSSPAPNTGTSYVIRLGEDTVAVERFTRVANRIESSIVQRSPQTFIGTSVVEIGANGLPSTWRYENRLSNGLRVPNGATAVFTFGTDSSTYQIVRDTGVATTRRIAGGGAIPSLTNSMMTQNLAIQYARGQGVDSVNVPTIGTNGSRGVIPVRFVTRDSVRVWYFGSPMYARLDPDGQVRWLDGSATTNKIMAVRTDRLDIAGLAAAFTAREVAAGPMGTASPRDTARAQIRGTTLWIDYGRPSLRGRNAWTNGVLGDTLWRTGANAATQFRTASDLRFGSQLVPAGMYTLWTHVFPGNSRYELVINKQVGQWGTVYDASQDLIRVPLTARQVGSSAERFTMTIEPSGDGGIIAMQWGTTRLEAPFVIVR